jgi:hypothetical protein
MRIGPLTASHRSCVTVPSVINALHEERRVRISPSINGRSLDIRENQLRLKREMGGLRDELFAREEEEVGDAHVVTDGENRQTDSEAKREWDARAKHLKQIR